MVAKIEMTNVEAEVVLSVLHAPVAAVCVNASANILFANSFFQALTGRDANINHDKKWFSYVDERERQTVSDWWHQYVNNEIACASGAPAIECPMILAEQNARQWHGLYVAPIRDILTRNPSGTAETTAEDRWVINFIAISNRDESSQLADKLNKNVEIAKDHWQEVDRQCQSGSAMDCPRPSVMTPTIDFVARVSHELRTPLNGILPMIEMLLRGDLSPEARTHAVTIKEAGSSLLTIVNDILDFAKLEAGKVEAILAEVDLVSTVESAVQMLAAAAATKNILLMSAIADSVPAHFKGDAQRIRQVLLNLCGNAIKFTEKGHVLIDVQVADNGIDQSKLVFSVSDSGPGLEPILVQHLFEPFFQGSDFNCSQVGTGLGLSISKRLVEVMGGTISVRSEQGVGCIFSFALPLESMTNSGPGTIKTIAQAQIDSTHVLTFEPKCNNRWVMAESLRSMALKVTAADQPETAIRLLASGDSTGSETRSILFLDMVRYASESQKLLSTIKSSNILHGLFTVAIMRDCAPFSEHPNSATPNLTLMSMPLRRDSIADYFNSLGRPPNVDTLQGRRQRGMQSARDVFAGARTMKLPQVGQQRRALVADDSQVNRYVAKLFLADMGFAVDLAGDGVQAVQAFKCKPYDLVFLDCKMPRMHGFDAAKIIKEIQGRRGFWVPIIAFTADAGEGIREMCLERDMDDYLSKPIDPKTLNRVVENWLGASTQTKFLQRRPPLVKLDGLASSVHLVDYGKLSEKFIESEIIEIFILFLSDCPLKIEELDEDFSARHLSAFEYHLNSFKCACRTIEAGALISACDRISMALKQHDLARVGDELKELTKLLSQLKDELNRLLDGRATVTLPTV